MIYDKCSAWQKYASLDDEGLFCKAFEALSKLDAATPEGRIDIIPGKLYINVFSYDAKDEADIKIEVHQKYTDIQCVLDGCENGIFASAENLQELEAYNREGDYAFYDAAAAEKVRMFFAPETFAVFFPGEGHSCCRRGGCVKVKKAVAKVLFLRGLYGGQEQDYPTD